MIKFDVVDFSERRSEGVVFLLTLGVYNHSQIPTFTIKSVFIWEKIWSDLRVTFGWL